MVGGSDDVHGGAVVGDDLPLLVGGEGAEAVLVHGGDLAGEGEHLVERPVGGVLGAGPAGWGGGHGSQRFLWWVRWGAHFR